MNLEEVLAEAEQINANGGAPIRPRFTIRNAAFALQPQPPIEYLVDKLITSGSVSVFFGEPGSKKTYSLLSLAVCAATGKAWLDFDIHEPLKILIIDEESGERRMTARLADTIRGELATGVDPDNLNYVSLAGFDLGKEADAKQVAKLIMDVSAQIVIIDALADIMSGDENSKQETQPVLSRLRKIAEDTDCAIILIHHSNKGGAYRGTSAIKGAVDMMVKVESENDSKFVNFATEKNRDGEPLKWSAVAIWSDGRFSMSPAEGKSETSKLTEPQKHVLGFLLENGDSTAEAIADAAVVCSWATARKVVFELAKGNNPYTTRSAESVAGGGRGHKQIFALTLAGKAMAEQLGNRTNKL